MHSHSLSFFIQLSFLRSAAVMLLAWIMSLTSLRFSIIWTSFSNRAGLLPVEVSVFVAGNNCFMGKIKWQH